MNVNILDVALPGILLVRHLWWELSESDSTNAVAQLGCEQAGALGRPSCALPGQVETLRAYEATTGKPCSWAPMSRGARCAGETAAEADSGIGRCSPE